MPDQSDHKSAASLLDVEPLKIELRKFAADRNWGQFHSPKNLVMALTGEVGELTELFQWLTEDESRNVCKDATASVKVEQELADVMLYLIRLSDVLGVDLNRAVSSKLKINAEKYPVGRAYGSSKKYDEL
ncbi:nucleotide pyrophosphohydrolase [Comamonas avium]|uniref:Nucleotide pyrophosphohydrolase n=1 Tax=Comamonas avium TaxID=2762231 RepID=A0ABR8SBS4_9BURK|nr:nucleotide pyrophosphohydrolase [Comamonas avium]MBD7960920.1 nucleotide pyrophosphohydrolase [Comamonas avium]